jgi:septal ring factor EnvC (AmiA/AmiB activator)
MELQNTSPIQGDYNHVINQYTQLAEGSTLSQTLENQSRVNIELVSVFLALRSSEESLRAENKALMDIIGRLNKELGRLKAENKELKEERRELKESYCGIMEAYREREREIFTCARQAFLDIG